MSLGHLNLRKNVIYAVVEFVANVVLVFFTYRLLILQGGLEAVGLWATLYAWTSLVRLGDAGMADATTRFVALQTGDRQAIRRFIETGILANVVLFAALTLVGYVVLSAFVPGWVGAEHRDKAASVLPWMLLGFFLFNVGGTVGGALQGLHLGFRRSQISMACTVLQLLVAMALVPSLGLVGLALAQIVQYAVYMLLAWILVRHTAGFQTLLPLHFDRATFRQMFGYSVKAQLANIANGLFEPVSKVLVAGLGGMVASGLYELAFKTVVLARNAVVAGVAATMPTLATLGDDRSAATALYVSSSSKSRIAIAAALLVVVASSPVVSWLWLGQLSVVFCFYVLAIAGGFFFNTLGAPAYNLGLTSGRLGGNIATAGGSVIALAIFGPVLGALLGVHAVVAFVGLCLAAGGLAIKAINERLLLERVPA